MQDPSAPQERPPKRVVKEITLESEPWCEDMDPSPDDDPDPPKIRGRPGMRNTSLVTASARQNLGPARRNIKIWRRQCPNLRKTRKSASSSI
jgi:hypothetical protein